LEEELKVKSVSRGDLLHMKPACARNLES